MIGFRVCCKLVFCNCLKTFNPSVVPSSVTNANILEAQEPFDISSQCWGKGMGWLGGVKGWGEVTCGSWWWRWE